MKLSRERKKFTLLPNGKISAVFVDIAFIVLFLYFPINAINNEVLKINFFGETVHYLWLASPLVLFYIFLRLIRLPLLLCGGFALLSFVSVQYINMTKMALTGEVLSWNDLVSGFNLSIAARYLTLWSLVYLFLALMVCGVLFYIGRLFYTSRKNYFFLMFLFMVAVPFSMYSHLASIFGESSVFSRKITLLASEEGIVYKSWDWTENLRDNGMAMHLVMTSSRKNPPTVTAEEQQDYLLKKRDGAVTAAKHKTIIYILCESCWYDEHHFKEVINPLLDEDYITFRATSPAYGGGTANVEFEMLTGLPSNANAVSGIIYQEYASRMRKNVDSLASALKAKGYNTYAAHNYLKEFWHRNIVYKKFGFDKFDDYYDMSGVKLPDEITASKQQWQWQPDDYLLYATALNALKNANGQSIFMNLITMSTHGPYIHNGDSGEGAYAYAFKQAIERVAEFTKKVRELDPDAVIVIYGDHKPALNKYFLEQGVMPANLFSKTGTEDSDFEFKWNIKPTDYGDVPVFVISNDHDAMLSLSKDANHQPYFCVSALVDKYLINSGLVSFNYSDKYQCNIRSSYDEKIRMFPPEYYSMALF